MDEEKDSKMEKDSILKQRKELKKRSRRVVKTHFFILFFVSLVMILFGTEYGASVGGWGGMVSTKEGDVLENVISSHTVIDNIMDGRLSEGKKVSEQLLLDIVKKGGSEILGRTNGVIATLINSASSGKPATLLADFIYSLVHSEKNVGIIFRICRILMHLLLFVFLSNVYSAVYRRIFMEARVYEHVFYGGALHFLAVRKWRKACWAMLVREIYMILWRLTIAGAFIKHYSYYAVPYIIGENPDVGANEAVTLSRKMMDGHKMEAFKYDLTMIGWVLLGAVTCGIADIIWGAAYRTACRTEFYVKIREDAIERNIEGTERLNDPYLFRKADRILLYETYFDVVDEITVLHENRIVLTGVRKFLADRFGIWIGTLEQKKKYDELEGRTFAIDHFQKCMDGTAYPRRLNPLWNQKKIPKPGSFSALRNYSVWTVFLLFILFSFIGWNWEVLLHYIQAGELVNRGTMKGPWLPIYGSGGVVVLLVCNRFRKNPVVEFFMSILLCGTLEYFAGWYLETTYHQRWWSYDGYFLNLHGRICAEGLLVFGVSCCVTVYLIAPVFDYLLSKIKSRILISVCVVLAVVFGADAVYSSIYPNMAKGAIERTADAESGIPVSSESVNIPPEAEDVASGTEVA